MEGKKSSKVNEPKDTSSEILEIAKKDKNGIELKIGDKVKIVDRDGIYIIDYFYGEKVIILKRLGSDDEVRASTSDCLKQV